MSYAFLGEIRMFAGPYSPREWILCDGTLLPIKGNEALYSLLGTTYGGDGRNNFAIPDMRGRIPIGAGQRPGLSARTPGQTGGVETVTLTETEMPPHTHTVTAATAPATTGNPTGLGLATAPATSGYYVPAGNENPGKLSALNALTIGIAGSSLPHNNMMPCLGLNYIICIQGLFPEHK